MILTYDRQEAHDELCCRDDPVVVSLIIVSPEATELNVGKSVKKLI